MKILRMLVRKWSYCGHCDKMYIAHKKTFFCMSVCTAFGETHSKTAEVRVGVLGGGWVHSVRIWACGGWRSGNHKCIICGDLIKVFSLSPFHNHKWMLQMACGLRHRLTAQGLSRNLHRHLLWSSHNPLWCCWLFFVDTTKEFVAYHDKPLRPRALFKQPQF